jgi:enterochelin esterase-like enzyme
MTQSILHHNRHTLDIQPDPLVNWAGLCCREPALKFLKCDLYMCWVHPLHALIPKVRDLLKRLLSLLWHPLLRGARLALVLSACIILVACSSAGQTPVTMTEVASASPKPAESEELETLTPQEDAIGSATPTLTAAAPATGTPTPGATATPTALPCWEQGGRFELAELESELLPDVLSYRIYLPPCYDEQPERLYPVLYLIHGQSFNDDQWERLGAGSVMDRLVAAEELPPIMIIMPRDRAWKEPTEDNFGRAVAEELVPWIDANYRTQPEREYRAVGGLSRGGAWALHLGLEYWELFGSIGAHSGFIFHTDTYLVKSWLDEIPFEELPRIFMDAPDKDRPPILQSALWFEDLLTQRGIPHEWRVYSGYHEEAYWQAHVEDYLRWYAQEWGTGAR